MRRTRLILLAAALVASRTARAQSDDDWSVTRTHHPATSHRPAAVHHPVAPLAPAAIATDPAHARRDRMIAALTAAALRDASDDAAPLAVLMRLVRERDGNIDALVRDFEARAQAAGEQAYPPHLALGHLYRQAGRYEDAIREYRTAVRIAPGAPAGSLALAAVLAQLDRGAEARAALEGALSHETARGPESDALRQLMNLALDAHDVPGARRYFERLVALDRASNTVRRELADALLARRMYPDAITEYQSVARALAGDNRVLPPVLRDLGRAYAGNDQGDEALRTYHRALALAGADAGVRRELYDAMTEVYAARNELPRWIAELEHMSGGDAYERAVLLGRLEDQAGNITGAIAAYRRAIGVRRGDVDAHVRLAQLDHQQGLRTDEITEYRALAVLAPGEPRFLTELADLLISEGHTDEARRMLAAASARAGSDARMHQTLAEVYARHGRQQETLRELELAARYDPGAVSNLVALGRQQMELGQRAAALATWHRILESSRDRSRGAVALADVYADNAMLDEAVAMYREAIRLRPDVLDYHRGLATVLERARQFDTAIDEWRRVIALGPSDRDTRRHAREAIVRIWGLQGRLAQQIPALQAAFERTPPDVEAGRDLAEALVRAHRAEDAERVLRRVTELDRADVTSLLALERVLALRGNLDDAIRVLARLCEADPRRARDYYQRMAQDALALHHDDAAIEYATHAVQLNDQDATAHLRLAEMYRARSDMAHAMASMRRALELNDRLFPTYFELADLYLGYRNEPREAIALYRRVIQLAPDDDYVNRAGRQAIQIAPAAGLADEVERDLVAASAAAPTRAVFRRLLVAFYDATARPLINRVQQGTLAETAQARADLAHIGARAIAPMLDALGDPDPAQQRIALDVLGYLGNPNATSALVAVAEGPGDPELRRRALAAAGALGDPRALGRLIAIQTTQPDPTLAAIATWAIAHVHAPAATAALVRSLEDGPPVEVQTMAALGLAGTHDPRARARLRTVLAASTASSVRAATAYALGVGGIDRASLPTLLAALGTASDVRLRAASAAALGSSGPDALGTVVPALGSALFAPGDAQATVRRAAARSLARLAGGNTNSASGPRAFDAPELSYSGTALLTALLDPPGASVDGARALVRFRRELGDAARDALSVTQERAQVVLAAFAEPGALAPLASAPDVAHTEGAAESLAAITTELVPALALLVTHRDPAVRRGAIRVLAGTNSPGAVEALARGVADPDESLASQALAALSHRGADPGAYDAVASRLAGDSPWSLRAAAAGALGAMDDPRAIQRLADALREDAFEYVRVAAAQALGRHAQDPAARRALERAARQDADPSVRAAAAAALAE